MGGQEARNCHGSQRPIIVFKVFLEAAWGFRAVSFNESRGKQPTTTVVGQNMRIDAFNRSFSCHMFEFLKRAGITKPTAVRARLFFVCNICF